MATRGKSARNKGNSYEREKAKQLRELHWKDCKTSRYSSKEKDDMLVDLVNTDPFSIQCKAVERLSGYHKLIDSMPKDGNINCVFHKRNRLGEVVVMSLDDFYKIITMLKKHNEL